MVGGTSPLDDAELVKGKTKLAGGDYKGAFKALDNARYSSDLQVRTEVSRLLRELAGRTDDGKLARKASEAADTLDREAQQRAARQADAAAAQHERARADAAKRYKVLTQQDRFFAGKFDPEKLEGAINAYAEQGWRVVSMATASVPLGLNQHRDEIIVLMTREPDASR
jgi:hypothetical protein